MFIFLCFFLEVKTIVESAHKPRSETVLSIKEEDEEEEDDDGDDSVDGVKNPEHGKELEAINEDDTTSTSPPSFTKKESNVSAKQSTHQKP